MSLYFDCAINSHGAGNIHVTTCWHPSFPLLAVGSYSEEKGGYVTVYTDDGEPADNVEIPAHPTAQVTSIGWHPTSKILAVGWENGELFLYSDHNHTCIEVPTLHNAAVKLLNWSKNGSRLVTGDTAGSVVGWSLDRSKQLNTVFHHELKDPLSQIIYRNNNSESVLDINGLARAAVAGDERALDLFSNWRPKTGKRGQFGGDLTENLNFYVGSMSGVIYYLNENGSCMEVLQADGAIKALLYHESGDILVVVTESLVVGQFRVESDGSLSEISKVKMSSRSADCSITWAGRGLLAITTGELSVRLWNLDSGDNFVLSGSTGVANTEFISSLAFSSVKSTLAAGTSLGNILLWKYSDISTPGSVSQETNWKSEPMARVGMAVKYLSWGSNFNILGVNAVREVFILREHQVSVHYNNNVSAVQVSPTSLTVMVGDKKSSLSCDIQIRGVFVTPDTVTVWNGHRVAVYDINQDSSRFMNQGGFNVECESLVVYEKSLYTLENLKINIRTFQGTIKQSLSLSDTEGMGICLDINSSFLVCATITGCVRMWDLSRREAKSHSYPKFLADHIQDFGEVISVKVNAAATKVSVLIAQSNLIPDPKLYIWDVENDAILYYNFASGKNDQDDNNSVPPNSARSDRGRSAGREHKGLGGMSGRVPVSHSWDEEEARLLIVEAKLLPGADRSDIRSQLPGGGPQSVAQASTVVTSMFVLEEEGMVLQDIIPIAEEFVKLVGMKVPFILLLRNPNGAGVPIEKKMIKDFAGLEKSDKKTRDAIVNFSMYLSIGNMDEAFKAIKAIKSEQVWENMARMCVKTKRLDVAAICLGNMKHAAGARAVRQALKSKEEPDVQAAILAVHLGMTEEAEQILLGCGRYDLVNKLYQDSGQWNKALDICENHDRIHLRNTYYNYAKHLEAMGDLAGAVPMFERSETHRFEVPRLLFDDVQMLESYVMKCDDPAIRKWWAQYMESTGEMETALHFYTLAKDYLSLVRVYCYCDNLEKAAEIASQTGDKAACYHLARQYENIDNLNEAIHFFTMAQAYSNAIRICKEQGLDDQVWNLSLLAPPTEQLDAARYFETTHHKQFDKAVILYEKSGHLGKALDLAFSTNQHNALQFISGTLDSNTDPVLLNRTADFFLQGGQFDKAVEMFAAAKNYSRALELCVNHNISVTEEMAERMSIPKDEANEEERINALDKIAEACFLQGNYHLATKKWTQAGMRKKAMKALLKSGDTEKIVFFANVSRETDIYVLAANYLQSLDWRNNPEIMKHIINFYTKGKAPKLLGGFYEACAQVEIDEYQNYEKALGALTEAYRCLSKSGDDVRLSSLKENIQPVKDFVDIQAMYDVDPDSAMERCKDFMTSGHFEMVRKGDVYGFMVEHYARNKQYKPALTLIEDMQARIPKVNIAYYINIQTIRGIEDGLGVRILGDSAAQGEDQDDDDIADETDRYN